MKQLIVGVFRCGPEQAQVVLREGTGGELYFVPEVGCIPRIKIGADGDGWDEVVSTLLHEAFEMELTRMRCRYSPAPDFGRDMGDFLFILTHAEFSEVCGRVSVFVADALPAVATAYKKWGRKK